MTGIADPGQSGVGQLDPFDWTSEFNVTAFIVRMMMAQLDTMKLVKVVGVTGGGGAIAKAGTVDVQPLVSLIDGAGNATPQGVAYGIPWWRLQGGANAVICDPVVGDYGYVICADRDTSGVLAAAAASKDSLVSPPGSYRQMNLADGIYVGGALNAVPTQYLCFTSTGLKIADVNGNVVELSVTGIAITPKTGMPVTVNGNLVVTGNLQMAGSLLNQAGVRYTGNLSTAGDIISATVNLRTHTHTQGVDSHGDTEAPTNPPS